MNPDELAHRFAYHPPITEQRVVAHEYVRMRCLALAEDLNECIPEGREKSLAITNLEQVMFWANAGIARDTP